MDKILKSIATLGFIGYFPAPGTMGTLVALPCAYGLSCMGLYEQVAIIATLFCISYFVIQVALKNFHVSDPSQIILDEVIGTLVTFYGIVYSPTVFFIGFVLFRLFDIFKPFGIRYLEKVPGSLGVLIDDIAAGICANLLLRYFFL
ncbi:MAG: phosphatidylglycerophosphatase A [Candidatus Dependentiae bacterium]|nr:phosphatidylglycerophosphatase A [Candidatus Dependentiae bacterium]